MSSKKLPDDVDHRVGEVEEEDKAGVGAGVSAAREANEHISTSVGTDDDTGTVSASPSDVSSTIIVDGNDGGGTGGGVSKGAGELTLGSVSVDRVAGESSSSVDEGATGSADSRDGNSVSASDDRIVLGDTEGRESTAVDTGVTARGAAVSPREAEREDAAGDEAPDNPEEESVPAASVPAATAQVDDEAALVVSASKNVSRTHSDQSRDSSISGVGTDRNDAAGHVVPSTENGVPLRGKSELSAANNEDKESAGKNSDVARAGQAEADVESPAAAPSPRKKSGKLWGWSLPAWAGGGGGGKSE